MYKIEIQGYEYYCNTLAEAKLLFNIFDSCKIIEETDSSDIIAGVKIAELTKDGTKYDFKFLTSGKSELHTLFDEILKTELIDKR